MLTLHGAVGYMYMLWTSPWGSTTGAWGLRTCLVISLQGVPINKPLLQRYSLHQGTPSALPWIGGVLYVNLAELASTGDHGSHPGDSGWL
jgi:hypothetical protein